MQKALLGKAPKLEVSSELHKAFENLKKEKAELETLVWKQQEEKEELQSRLDFVETIVGPTESQRKEFQQQLVGARAAAIHASHSGSCIPTRFLGRLDVDRLAAYGISEHDCALLQRGCVPGDEGVPQDVSLLGDPNFCPYDPFTLEPRWEARGGFLQLTLGDVRDRWGTEVAMEVLRCAIELDRHDASRRLGLEVPWNSDEGRELQPAEVIMLLAQEMGRGSVVEPRGRAERRPERWNTHPTEEGAATPEWSMLESVLNDLGLDMGNLSRDSRSGPSTSSTPLFEDSGDLSEVPFDSCGNDIAPKVSNQRPLLGSSNRTSDGEAQSTQDPTSNASALSLVQASSAGSYACAEASGMEWNTDYLEDEGESHEALLEFLEEEVATSLRRLLAGQGPASVPHRTAVSVSGEAAR